jgi:hypothetical protein
MSQDINNYVIKAILNTKENSPDYFIACLKQRLADGQGSTTDFKTVEELEKALLAADWEKFEHPNIAENCLGFITKSFGGHMGMIPLEKLDKDAVCGLTDIKGTGTLSLVYYSDEIDRYDVDYNVLIVGNDGFGPCMFTFHPGEPLKPSTLSSDGSNEFSLCEGDVLTAEEAMEKFGFKHAKLINPKNNHLQN